MTVELGIHVWTPDSDAQVVKKVKSAAGHPLFLPDINVVSYLTAHHIAIKIDCIHMILIGK